jgi:hypothetical protein
MQTRKMLRHFALDSGVLLVFKAARHRSLETTARHGWHQREHMLVTLKPKNQSSNAGFSILPNQ